jgi:catechol 2,3-dioxygenase-like lactoylglutathione lyase family enzyme
VRVDYAIVFVSDMSRAVIFYRDVLELPLRFESAGWIEFATDGATLALHEAQSPGAGPATHPAAGHCRPGLSVPDLDAFHARMLAAGVPCLQPPKDVFGARVAQYQDPDGLIISVGEATR